MRYLFLFPLLLALAHSANLVWDAGVFRTIPEITPGPCRLVGSMPGPEDMAWSDLLKGVIISGDHRSAPGEFDPRQGGLFLWTSGEEDPKPLELKNREGMVHPHGLGIWEENSALVLYVVNHKGSQSVIERYIWRDNAFRSTHSFSDPMITTPNDVAPIDSNRFFFTNDHSSKSRWAQQWETFSRWGRGSLVYFDGKTFTRLLSNINFANGVVFDPIGKRLYMAAMLEKRVHVYLWDDFSARLIFSHYLSLPAAPDNVTLDQEGRLWVAAHPKLFQLKSHSEDFSKPSPSQVFVFDKPNKEDASAKLVLSHSGARLSAASVALNRKGRLLIGSIFQDRLLDCDLAH